MLFLPRVHAPTLLCIRSSGRYPGYDEALASYRCVTFNSTQDAARNARLRPYDAYIAMGSARSWHQILLWWRTVRRFDSNTPLVLVSKVAVPGELAAMARTGFEHILVGPEGAALFPRLLRHLLRRSAKRSMRAAREVFSGIAAEVKARIAAGITGSRFSAVAVIHTMEPGLRAQALELYIHAGGSRVYFEELWAHVFDNCIVELTRDESGEGGAPEC